MKLAVFCAWGANLMASVTPARTLARPDLVLKWICSHCQLLTRILMQPGTGLLGFCGFFFVVDPSF
ncbi:hypothetical protein ALQ24_200042 [Pseudomonas syringae pv. antirrhini]|nr:hypothetical protein ALQ24_200042 [Pseudomonas syringae pv. antirrhini]